MSTNRIHEIDSIRGFAIIGILFINIQSFSWPELYDSFPSSYWVSGTDSMYQWLQYIFIKSNFYPLFSLLFGIGMEFMYKSVIKKGLKPSIVFFRRFLFLLLIGTCHAFFIWHGDILMTYAMIGFLTIPFLKVNSKRLAWIGGMLFFVPNILYSFYLSLMDWHSISTVNHSSIMSAISNYTNGYLSSFQQNLIDFKMSYPLDNLYFLFMSIFPFFLLGLALAKCQWFTRITNGSIKLSWIWLVVGVIGFSIKLLPVFDKSYLLFWYVSDSFGGPFLSIFYALSILGLTSVFKRISAILSRLGRVSMTNYLVQSLLGFTIFKGFGLYGIISPTGTLGIAIIIVFLQVFLSHFWLKKFQYGPLEWVWRKTTYGQMLDSNKNNSKKIVAERLVK